MFQKFLRRTRRRPLCRSSSSSFSAVAPPSDSYRSQRYAVSSPLAVSRKSSIRPFCLHSFRFLDRKGTPFYGGRSLSDSASSRESYRTAADDHQLHRGVESEGGIDVPLEREREDSHPIVEGGVGYSVSRVKEEGKESVSQVSGEGKAECCARLEGEEGASFSKSEGDEESLSSLDADDDTGLTSNIEEEEEVVEEDTDLKSDLDEVDKHEMEADEDDGVDLSNVSDDLKEMLQDGYVIESIEDDGFSNGATELLTIDEIKQVLEEVRARDVQIFSVSDRCEWTDTMVVATGISDRHVRGIADALVYKIKKKEQVESSLYPTIEGQVGGKWLVVDCGNVIIHILDEESRGYYKLEDLWTGTVTAATADEDLHMMLKKAGLKDPNY